MGRSGYKKVRLLTLTMKWSNSKPFHSVTLRPFETRDTDKYNIFCMGHDLDAEKMASSREEFIRAFYETTRRTDIEFGDVIWLSNFQ